MYIDNRHSITKIQNNGISGIQKRLPRELLPLLKKEILLLQYLQLYEFHSPTLIETGPDFFTEEFISDIKYNVSENIPNISNALYQLHNIPISNNMKQVLHNPYLKNKKHNTDKLFNDLIQPLPPCAQKEEFIMEIRNYICKNPLESEKIAIIHGDLNPNNILKRGEYPYLIDWGDARIDLPSFDIAQLFYVHNFSLEDQNLFWLYYPDKTSILHRNIFLHFIFLILYELGILYIENQIIDNNKILLLQEMLDEQENYMFCPPSR